MKKKKILPLIFIAVAIIIIIIGIVFLLLPINKKETKETSKSSTELGDRKEVEICKTEDCKSTQIVEYAYIEVNSPNKQVKDMVEKLNKKTNQYYEKTKNSNMDDASCSNVKDMYYHSYKAEVNPFSYVSADYISVAIQANEYYLCTEEIISNPVEAYIYDVKENKILTQEEFLKKKNITEEKITSCIEENVKVLNNIQKTSYTLNDVYDPSKKNILFYDFDGNLLISYYNKITKYYETAIVQ